MRALELACVSAAAAAQGVPLMRTGSGTAWQPDATPAHMRHVMAGDWMLMLHGVANAGLDAQGSDRGRTEGMSTNWIMLMAEHGLAGGTFEARAMLTAEPAIDGKSGYPLLLQSGEAVGGVPLHDRQHPHDLFMETALRVTHPLAGPVGVELYGGPAGEPALGPVAFMHRASAAYDPLPPIGHHWQDSTHVTFGVVTAGLFTRHLKVEGSWFNGREPDEDRYDFDLRRFDSWSARLTVAPSASWTAQASWGRLGSPEELHPDVSVQRVTASVMHAGRYGATTLVWGRNIPSEGKATDSLLLESTLGIGRWATVFGRGEIVSKPGDDLLAPDGGRTYTLGEVVLGAVHDFGAVAGLVPGLGVRGAVNFVGASLEPLYGTRTPVGGVIFLRLAIATPHPD